MTLDVDFWRDIQAQADQGIGYAMSAADRRQLGIAFQKILRGIKNF